MPNGYTASIYDNEDITFEEFILRCARGFGFTIMQRDDPFTVPLKTHYEPETAYYDEQQPKAQAELNNFLAMSFEQIKQAHQIELDEALAYYNKRVQENSVLRARYNLWIYRVRQWVVPYELQDMKQSIIDWLLDSLRNDCCEPTMPLVDQTTLEWYNEKIARLQRDILYYITNREKEIERTRERNHYLDLLVKSLESYPDES